MSHWAVRLALAVRVVPGHRLLGLPSVTRDQTPVVNERATTAVLAMPGREPAPAQCSFVCIG